MALEPRGWPWDLARLTDFQIERLYVKPAAKRASEMSAPGGRGESSGPPAAADASREDISAGAKQAIEAGQIPPKAAIMNLLMTFGGMSAKDAAEEYERQLAEHKKRTRT